jgi:hypothetical protein
MAQRDNILQELRELKSVLAGIPPRNIYQVPDGYFEGLAGQVISRIKAMGTEDVGEPDYISPLLTGLKKQMPYSVPEGYFDSLEKRVAAITQADHETPQQELEQLSPLLGGIKKQTPYSVPEGYFDSLALSGSQKKAPGAKVISITRQWYRYAAAAVVITFVALGGFFFFNKKENIDPKQKSYTWVKNNMNKVSTDELDEFITITEKEAPVVAATTGTDEVKELMKNVSDKEIQNFLNDTEAITDADEDLLLN